VAQLVTGMAGLLGSTVGPQIELVVDAPAGLPSAKADANQLEMALLNLVVNSRDAMPAGGTIRISVGTEMLTGSHRAGLPQGDYLYLSVADTGSGMDEATLARSVEPFFSTKGIGRGTGLGLSMVHGLALQLGGAMTLSSQPGVGTHVELWLPTMAREDAVAEHPMEQAFSPPAEEKTVLLVDDEALVRMATADMLADFGYRVVEASSSEEALRLVRAGLKPDLLVTDHLMAGMSGTDLARTLRSDGVTTKTLVVSGYAELDGLDPDIPRLNKPFRRADLANTLATLGI
jgi:CheY-like chemotaxis protein